MIGAKPYGTLRFREIRGRRMAYVDEGQGDSIVFQHGQPTSSYVWRNVMPHLEGMGRLVACDLIGMGGSDKLAPSGPDRYRYPEHREYLFALWEALELGDRVVLVLDDWGAVLGFDWAHRHPHRVRAIVHMEAVVMPMRWSDIAEQARPFFRALRSPEGERMVLEENLFVERRLPGAALRGLTEEELDHYRRPFLKAGEDRRPTLSWPRSLPIDGEPADVASTMNDYLRWLPTSDVPKLFVNGDPGAIVTGRIREAIRTWRNQSEVTVRGLKLLQEDSADEIGASIRSFLQGLRRQTLAQP
ncbi:MAG TPA: haloalkane dehalogenase [Myxococcaceae bacterium]|nr:haloalkane dehalogenase [Myxococcaceae bacterium]